MDFLNDGNFNQNQIINVALHRASVAPSSPVQGQIYYNTSTPEGIVYYWNGTSWVSMAGDITEVIAGAGLTGGGTSGSVTLDLNVDNATLEVVGDIVRIKDVGVTTPKIADGAVITAKILDKNILFGKIQDIPTMTLIGRVAAGSGSASAIAILDESDMISNSPISLATQRSIKAYVDNSIAGLGKLMGGFDANASTNFPSNASTKKGDYWYVTVAGTVQGVVFNIGDVIIANQDAATNTNPNHFIFLETNRGQATTSVLGLVTLATSAEVIAGTDTQKVVTPATLAALTSTESRRGLIELATQAEVNTGTDVDRAVTPATLKAFFDSKAQAYVANIGNGVATAYAITHNLNSTDVDVTVFRVSSGAQVIVDNVRTNANTVTLTFSTAPTTNQFRVLIRKVA